MANRRHILYGLVGLAVGLGAGYAIARSLPPAGEVAGELTSVRQSGQQFTNPLLECEVAEGRINRELVGFRPKIEQYVSQLKTREGVTEMAVYFRELNNGWWFGLNEQESFIPASLLKVPVMMAYFRAAESDPSLLEREITVEKVYPLDPGYSQHLKPSQEISLGQTYTVAELVEHLIVHSDNQATRLLHEQINPELIRDVYRQLGVPATLVDQAGTLTVKQYAAFFRILFNASYLNREYSEQALEILSRVEFDQGLRVGVPAEVPVAHKFGEAGSFKSFIQLHDCGIVYYPGHPYLLCLMTRGQNLDALTRALADTSRMVYEEVDS